MNQPHNIIAALLLTLFVAAAGPAQAEKADSNKPTTIEADHGLGENVSQVRTLIGNVVLVKGTLIMKAGKAVVTEDPEGYQFVTFWAAPGALANFRQKRDGGPDLWMEGEAERIEYDNKTEIVKLFSKSKVTQLDGKRVTDEAEGPFISYDSRKEVFALENTVSGESRTGGGRVKMTLQPKPQPGAKPAAPGSAAVTAPATVTPAAAATPAATATPAAAAPAAAATSTPEKQ